MHRHAILGAWLKGPPGALGAAFEWGALDLLGKRRCPEGGWRSERFGACCSKRHEFWGIAAMHHGALQKRQGAGP